MHQILCSMGIFPAFKIWKTLDVRYHFLLCSMSSMFLDHVLQVDIEQSKYWEYPRITMPGVGFIRVKLLQVDKGQITTTSEPFDPFVAVNVKETVNSPGLLHQVMGFFFICCSKVNSLHIMISIHKNQVRIHHTYMYIFQKKT